MQQAGYRHAGTIALQTLSPQAPLARHAGRAGNGCGGTGVGVALIVAWVLLPGGAGPSCSFQLHDITVARIGCRYGVLHAIDVPMRSACPILLNWAGGGGHRTSDAISRWSPRVAIETDGSRSPGVRHDSAMRKDAVESRGTPRRTGRPDSWPGGRAWCRRAGAPDVCHRDEVVASPAGGAHRDRVRARHYTGTDRVDAVLRRFGHPDPPHRDGPDHILFSGGC